MASVAQSISPPSSAAADAGLCYHCGLPLSGETQYRVSIDSVARPMCCAGCEAVAQAIVANGLTDYYRHRDALPDSPRVAVPDVLKDASIFDHAEVQRTFVSPVTEHEREASLILEGITCAACIWLNEQHVARQPGVTAVDINYATRRARVRWDERRTKLSQILAAIAAIGYRAYPYDAARSDELARRERRAALWRLFVAGFGMMQVMMYAVPVYLADEGTMSADIEQLMRWASLILTLPVVLYSAAPFFRSAWRDLRLRRLGMDVPVALGVGSAFAASVWATLAGTGQVYFDSVTMFVFLLLCGRYLEMVARQRSVRGVEQLARVLPAFAVRLLHYPRSESERVPVATLAAGDVVLVKPGEVIPADAVVVDGESSVDESLLTGESAPVTKACGAAVIGGSTNRGSPLVLRVEHVGAATRLAAIQRLMERAQAEKPRVAETADRAAAYFVVFVLAVAAVTAAVWYSIDPQRALWVFVSVLVVSCPCALSLATPAALAVAVGALARAGVLVTRGHAIETLARATHLVFDKTGTLTLGRLQLMQVVALGELDREQALHLAAALEQHSEHPIGSGLRAAAGTERGSVSVSGIRTVTGQGVEGQVGGRRVRIGRPAFVAELHGRSLPEAHEHSVGSGHTWVALGDERGWLALFGFGDEVRRGAAELFGLLRSLGVEASILSGDSPPAVAALAGSLGVVGQGALTPQGKHERIVELQGAGAIVAMVGDGVNDAPVLAQAQVSVAMGGGTDLARTQGDFVLLGDDLRHLAHAIQIARRTLRVIRQNLIWSAAYNVVALPLAMAGWVTPWQAGVGMSVSSLLVVANALRLARGTQAAATERRPSPQPA